MKPQKRKPPKNRKGNAVNNKAQLRVLNEGEHNTFAAYFAKGSQTLLPLLRLVNDNRASIDKLMSEAACRFVEQLLVLSAQEVAGTERPTSSRRKTA